MSARTALVAGDFERAQSLLEQCRLRAPAWAEPYYLLSRCAEHAGEARDVQEALLLDALERNPGHTAAERKLLAIRAWRHAPLTESWHLYHGGRVADALDAFLAALESTGERLPESSRGRVHAGIGWCHHDLGALPASILAFEQAVQLEPALGHAHKGLGIALYRQDRYPEAELALLRALECEPRLFDALSFVGWCRYALGAYAEALAVFRQAFAANAALGDAAWGIAWCLWRLHEVDGAASAFLAAGRLEPGHPSAPEVQSLVLTDPGHAALAREWSAVISGAEAPRPRPPLEVPEPKPLVEALAALHDDRPADCLAILEQVRPENARERWQLRVLDVRSRKALGVAICEDGAPMPKPEQHTSASGEELA